MDDIKFPDEIKEKCLDYQIPYIIEGAKILKKYGRLLDASDTGVGKSYDFAAICCLLKLKPFVVCTKSMITGWKRCFKHFKLKYYGITNYESLQNCQYFPYKESTKEKCPFIKKKKEEEK